MTHWDRIKGYCINGGDGKLLKVFWGLQSIVAAAACCSLSFLYIDLNSGIFSSTDDSDNEDFLPTLKRPVVHNNIKRHQTPPPDDRALATLLSIYCITGRPLAIWLVAAYQSPFWLTTVPRLYYRDLDHKLLTTRFDTDERPPPGSEGVLDRS